MKRNGISKNEVLTGALATSVVANVAMANQMNKLEKRTDNTLEVLNRASLIATYYVLKKDPTNQLKQFKEETKMKKIKFKNKFGAKVSNATKTTITVGVGLLAYGIGRAINSYTNNESIDVEASEPIREAIENIAENTSNIVDDTAELIEF